MSPPIKQPTFAGGEISPTLYARTDNALYEKSLRTLRNMITMRQGGVTGRPGTMYVGTTLNGGNPVRLIPFIFNETGLGQSYVLEFGNLYVAFYQNGGVIETSPGVPYIVATSYVQADLQDLKFAQSADVITIVHPSYPVYEFRRTSSTNWNFLLLTNTVFAPGVLNPIAFSIVGTIGADIMSYCVTAINASGEESSTLVEPYTGTVFQSNTLVAASIANPIFLNWNPSTNAVAYRVYFSRAVVVAGVVIPLNQWGFIGSVNGNTTITPGIIQFKDTGIIPDYNQSPPSRGPDFYAGPGSYPSAVGYIQQRRAFAATNNNPIGFWLSRSGSPYNFFVSRPVVDSDPILASLSSEEVNKVEHLFELKFGLMLTAGTEIFIQGDGQGVITPFSINASTQSQYGSSPIRPLKVGDVLLFTQALGSFIRDFSFDFAIDGYRGNDITVFASHLFEGYQIVDWGYQKVPDSLIWVVRSDGVLLCCTYIREQQVLAWSHHDFTNGTVENVCCIPENGEYAVYLSIKRVINGSTVRYIERMSSRIWSDPINASYLDCFAKYNGVNATTNGITLSVLSMLIVTGVNDTIQFTDGGVQYAAIIPGGGYLPANLAIAVTTAMNAKSNRVYSATIAGGIFFQITNDGTPFTLEFSSTSTNFNRSIGTTLGFLEQNYVVTAGTVSTYPNPFSIWSENSIAYQQTILLTSDTAFFTIDMIGDEIDISVQGSDTSQGYQLRVIIQEYASSTLVYGTPSGIVPEGLRGVLTTTWARAVKTVSGLNFLIGQEVSVWADRFVVGSPLNYHISAVYTVSDTGTLTLDKPYATIYVGLPIVQDVQTLDRETAAGESILASRKRSSKLDIYVQNTRTLFVGTENPDTNLQNTDDEPLFQMFELIRGTNQVTYDQPPELVTDQDYVFPETRWNKNGRLFIRNVDPTPLTILAIGAEGDSKAPTPFYEKL